MKELEDQNLAVESEGATAVFLDGVSILSYICLLLTEIFVYLTALVVSSSYIT